MYGCLTFICSATIWGKGKTKSLCSKTLIKKSSCYPQLLSMRLFTFYSTILHSFDCQEKEVNETNSQNCLLHLHYRVPHLSVSQRPFIFPALLLKSKCLSPETWVQLWFRTFFGLNP